MIYIYRIFYIFIHIIYSNLYILYKIYIIMYIYIYYIIYIYLNMHPILAEMDGRNLFEMACKNQIGV